MSDPMLLFVSIVHVLVALFLIVFVLLQDSKGGALGALGGGGGNTLFGSTGASSFLVKITRWAAIVFAATCISLTWHTTKKDSSALDAVPGAGAGSLPVDSAPVDATAPAQKDEAPKSNDQ